MQPPRNNLKKQIFSTLLYFDIFDFPVAKGELFRFLHTSKKVLESNLEEVLQTIPHKKSGDTTFYFLPKRDELIKKRQEKYLISEQKIKQSSSFIKFLGFLPTITFIGVSGSLAMKNGGEDSDIDLFVITLPHAVWLTRFLLWVILSITSKMRKRNDKGKDAFCVNMFVDTKHLLFEKKRQDIYTAHEIVQLLPMVNKYQMYEIFLQKNSWILEFLADSFEEKKYKDNIPFWLKVVSFCLIPLEYILYNMQILYMKNHQTIEITSPTFIAFHPHDYRDTITKELKGRLTHYAI